MFGGTGPVGRIAALIAAQAGAKVSLVGYDGLQRVTATCDQFGERFGVAMSPGRRQRRGQQARRDRERRGDPRSRPGRHPDPEQGAARAPPKQLLVALDVNAVPPAGPRRHRRVRRRRADRGHARGSALARWRSATSSSRPSTSFWRRCATPIRAATSALPRRSRPRAGMPPAEPVLICALSGRALAAVGAGRGLRPNRARRVRRSGYPRGGGGVAANSGRPDTGACGAAPLLAAAARLAPPPIPLVWGSGFERAPGAAGRTCRPGANSGAATPPRCVRLKDPLRLRRDRPQSRRAASRGAARPAAERPRAGLCKRAGGAGGGHVRRRERAPAIGPRLVLAAPRTGTTGSALVVGQRPRRRRSWASASSGARRCRHGRSGSAGRSLRPSCRRGRMSGVATLRPALAAHYGLRRPGERRSRSSHGDEIIVLEINPRPGASLDARARARWLTTCSAMHVAACRGRASAECAARRMPAASADRLCGPVHHRAGGFRLARLGRRPYAARHPDRARGGPVCTVLAEGARRAGRSSDLLASPGRDRVAR